MKLNRGCFYGRTISKRTIGDFNLTETLYTSDEQLPKHFHETAYFCFVLEGCYTEYYQKNSLFCRPSTLIFHSPFEKHSGTMHSKTRCFNIEINNRWIEGLKTTSEILKSSANFDADRLTFLSTRIYREFLETDEFSALVVEGVMLEMIAEVSRGIVNPRKSVPPKWLRLLRKILDEKFNENLNLQQLSEIAGVHPMHMAAEFRKFYHSTIGEYVRQNKVKFACQQILASETPLSQIALEAGFFDQSHLTRIFKKCVGVTPKEYRHSLRKNRR